MTAEIIPLPVIRIERFDDHVRLQTALDLEIYKKLRSAASRAGCEPEEMAEALVIYGLAAIERKPVEAFYVQSNVEHVKERADGILAK